MTAGIKANADGSAAIQVGGSDAITITSGLVVSMNGGTPYPLTSGTSVTASSTSVDFTGIPSWVKRITVMFSGVSTSGTSNILVQIGAGSVTATGYVGSVNTANASANSVFSTGFMVLVVTASANLTYGQIVLTNISGNTWVESSSLSIAAASSAGNQFSAGVLALGGTLDRVRITTINGTDTFDAGTINILYE